MTLKEACETALAIEADGRMIVLEISFAYWLPQGYPAPYRVKCMARTDNPRARSYFEFNERPRDVLAELDSHFTYFAAVKARKEHDEEPPDPAQALTR